MDIDRISRGLIITTVYKDIYFPFERNKKVKNLKGL